MNIYQTLIILKPSLSEDDAKAFEEKFKKGLEKIKFEMVSVESFGKRELATYFDKLTNGFYLRITYKAETKAPALVATLAKNNTEVVRQLTSRLEKLPEPATQAA